MFLTTISTDRHFDPGVDQVTIALIHRCLHPFIDQIKIDIDSFTQSSLSQKDNCLNAGMRRGCG